MDEKIKKESPNEGTETVPYIFSFQGTPAGFIKKESPNEGTETGKVRVVSTIHFKI